MAKKKSAGCEYCSNYVYDEDYEYYVCDINLDEDEMARFMSYSDWDCPYFQMDDEYADRITIHYYDADGKLYLYDIIRTKKETSKPHEQ